MIPTPPWYKSFRRIIAPSERVSNLVLLGIVLFTLLIVWKGDPVTKGLWAVYLVSP